MLLYIIIILIVQLYDHIIIFVLFYVEFNMKYVLEVKLECEHHAMSANQNLLEEGNVKSNTKATGSVSLDTGDGSCGLSSAQKCSCFSG